MKNKLIILFGLAILVVAYLYFSSPGEVVVNGTGEVLGLINNVRATLQGKRFWRGQLREVDSEIDKHLSDPQFMTETRRALDQVGRKTDQALEEVYKKNPEIRPSPAERQAEALRERADRIEWGEGRKK